MGRFSAIRNLEVAVPAERAAPSRNRRSRRSAGGVACRTGRRTYSSHSPCSCSCSCRLHLEPSRDCRPSNREDANGNPTRNHNRTRRVILCWIAHIAKPTRIRHYGRRLISARRPPHGSEQFRPAILLRLSDHDARDEHFFSLFQVF